MRRNRKRMQNNNTNDSWLLPYADMLTLLLALFIVLYASSEIDEQKFFDLRNVFHEHLASGGSTGIIADEGQGMNQSPDEGDSVGHGEEHIDENDSNEEEAAEHFSEIQRREFLQMQKQINAYISAHELEEQLSIQLTDEGLLLTIVNDVLFDSGSAEVKEDSYDTAQELARLLYTDPPHQIVISGHTDNVPIKNSAYESNWELSVERALNFMNLVLENNDLDPSLFSVKGFGETKPLYPNDTPENRAKNRRVEVLILPNIELNES